MDAVAVELAQGLHRNGVFHRLGLVAPLNGWAEFEMEGSAAARAANVDNATRLLAATLGAIGEVAPVTVQDIAALTVGDRERLLFALYRASFGPNVELVATCLRCEEVCELDIPAAAAAPPATEPKLVHHFTLEDGGATWRIGFRMPTGSDQAELARSLSISLARSPDTSPAPADGGGAEALLFRRCVVEATLNGKAVTDLEPDAAMLGAFEEALRHADPAAEGATDFACQACGASVEVMIDAAAILRGALANGGGVLSDVHRIARVYHWSEGDILSLSCRRRRDYLALIAEAGQP